MSCEIIDGILIGYLCFCDFIPRPFGRRTLVENRSRLRKEKGKMCKDLVLVFLCFLLVGAMGAPQGGEFEDVDLPPGTGRMLDIKFIPPSKLQSPIFEVVDPHDFVSLIKINNSMCLMFVLSLIF